MGKAWALALGMAICSGAWAQQAPAVAPSDANPMRAGAWESRTEASSGGRSGGEPAIRALCIDQSWIDAQAVYAAGDKPPFRSAVSCREEERKRAAGFASWTTVCKLAGGGEARARFERQAGPESVVFATEASAVVGGKPRQLTVRTAMRRVGDSCPAGAARLTGALLAKAKK